MKLPLLNTDIKTNTVLEYLCLNMQIMHYLIKYVLICIDFQKRNLNIG